MAQSRIYGIWRDIAQFALSHMSEAPSPLVKMAARLLKGNLAPLPDHIVLSAQLQSLSHRVLAHAISSNGKIAILMARDDFSCGLITWSQEEGLWEQGQRDLWTYTERLPLGVLFPHGCEDPLVYFGEDHEDGDLHHIRWGDFHHELPAQPNIFEVNAWVEDGYRCLTYRTGDKYNLHRRHKIDDKFTWDYIDTNQTVSTPWMGHINGRYAEILNQGDVQSLKWHGGEVVMPDETHKIDVSMICSSPNVGVWFVSQTQERDVEYLWWSNGTETKCTENRGENIEREGILLMRGESGEVFVENDFYPLSLHDHLLFRNNLMEHGEMRHIWKHLTRVGGACHREISRMDRLGPKVDRAHDGKIMNRTLLLWIEKEKQLMVYRALDSGAQTKTFSLYGPYFPTLTVVGPIDRREILGFMLVDHTLHIVRYRLW